MGGDQNPQQRVMPTLRMTDYARSKQFYVDGLGFQVDWEHRFEPGFPVFMQVSRDGLAFFLTEHAGDCPAGGLIHLYVPDVDAWFDEFRRKGVRVQETPKSRAVPPVQGRQHRRPDARPLPALVGAARVQVLLAAAGSLLFMSGAARPAALPLIALMLGFLLGVVQPLRAAAIQRLAEDAIRARAASAASACDMAVSRIVLPLAGVWRSRRRL